eukprot:SAG31_NODE_1018_length_10354_cov_10.995514_14_plen_90_part_00
MGCYSRCLGVGEQLKPQENKLLNLVPAQLYRYMFFFKKLPVYEYTPPGLGLPALAAGRRHAAPGLRRQPPSFLLFPQTSLLVTERWSPP